MRELAQKKEHVCVTIIVKAKVVSRRTTKKIGCFYERKAESGREIESVYSDVIIEKEEGRSRWWWWEGGLIDLKLHSLEKLTTA